MDDAAVVEEQQEVAETAPEPKRKRGRPLKIRTDEERAAIKLANDITGPRYLKYNSDSHNKNQKTSMAWAWADELPASMKEIADLTVYRDWPMTLGPLDESDAKSIDKLLCADPNFIKSDQDLVDRYGAGDYRCYFNVNPKVGPRRLLFTAYVKCTHNFRDFPPTDRRIDDVAKVDLFDKSNGSYVAWLRANGRLKDEQKETEDMAANASATAGLTEIVGKALDRGDRLMEKLIEKESTPALPVDPPPSPQEVISEQLSIFKSLKELVPTSDPLEMVKQVIGMAQVLTSKDGSADLKPLQDEISKLREESRATEREMWRVQFAELKEQIRVAKETPPASNVLLPDGSNIQSVIEKAVAKAVDAGLPEDTAWYVEPLKQLVPVAIPALGILLQRLMAPAPPPAPFPMPPANFQAGQPQTAPPQQLPAPQPQAQPAAPQPSNEEVEINRILTAISSPVIDALASGDEGDAFADYVREEFGASSQRLLAKFSEQEIAGALMMFPLTAPRMTQFPQARVAEFVKSFKEYNRDVYDLKIEAQERSK